jgi:hypothetical protein
MSGDSAEELAAKLPNANGMTSFVATAPSCPVKTRTTIAPWYFSCCMSNRKTSGARPWPRPCAYCGRGGQLIIVDYHRPRALHPLFLPMAASWARSSRSHSICGAMKFTHWLPAGRCVTAITKRIFFGGLYQLVKVTV